MAPLYGEGDPPDAEADGAGADDVERGGEVEGAVGCGAGVERDGIVSDDVGCEGSGESVSVSRGVTSLCVAEGYGCTSLLGGT